MHASIEIQTLLWFFVIMVGAAPPIKALVSVEFKIAMVFLLIEIFFFV